MTILIYILLYWLVVFLAYGLVVYFDTGTRDEFTDGARLLCGVFWPLTLIFVLVVGGAPYIFQWVSSRPLELIRNYATKKAKEKTAKSWIVK